MGALTDRRAFELADTGHDPAHELADRRFVRGERQVLDPDTGKSEAVDEVGPEPAVAGQA
jgi:hypothetical protein